MTSLGSRGLPWAVLLLAAGCAPTVGANCDMATATGTIAYDELGNPAYLGQSMMITSCSAGGAYCHSSGALHRYGAPYGMNFDPTLADDASFGSRDEGERHLLAARTDIFEFRDDIYAQVLGGQMPPRNVGDRIVQDALSNNDYRVYSADPNDRVGTVVPSIRTADGREILRNWLACDAPMIEGTTPVASVPCSSDGDCAITRHCATSETPPICNTVGDTTAARTIDVQPTWDSIYSVVLSHNCARSSCHDSSGAPFSGHLDMSTADLAYANLVGVSADQSACGTRVVAGDSAGSFLIAKIEGTQNQASCGDTMPIGGMLPHPIRMIIAQWIDGGALQH